MRRRTALKVLSAWSVLLLFAFAGSGLAEPGSNRDSSTATGEPIPVTARLHLLDLNSVNTESETFSVNGDLYLSWPTAGAPENWAPEVHLVNAQELTVFYRNERKVEVDGVNKTVQKLAFQGDFNSQFHFSDFPFDSSRLKIYLEPAQEGALFQLYPGPFSLDPLAFDSQWAVQELKSEQVDTGGRDPNASDRLKFSFGIQRLWRYHLWYYFLPLLLITAIPWSVFWYRPPNPQVPVVSMLGLVAYNMVFARHLPQLGYLTLADAFFLHCLAGIFIATVACAAVLNASAEPEREKRLSRLFRWSLPLVQVGSGAALVLLW